VLSQFAGSPARLWNRIGWYRVLAVVLLVAAVAGGVVAAIDRPTQRPAVASKAEPNSDSSQQSADAEAQRAEAERAARQDAQRKADAAAIAAAETAKASGKPSAKASASPKPSKSAVPPKPPLPIPASCAVYSGHKATGCAAVLAQGWSLAEMACLEKLWDKESHWNPLAHNSSSGAHGIPQAVPGSKMGPGWETDPVVQINWGIGYIKGRYGKPCTAWAHSQSTGWY
jgi:hypothetical protein